jgi:hypothetical protein
VAPDESLHWQALGAYLRHPFAPVSSIAFNHNDLFVAGEGSSVDRLSSYSKAGSACFYAIQNGDALRAAQLLQSNGAPVALANIQILMPNADGTEKSVLVAADAQGMIPIPNPDVVWDGTTLHLRFAGNNSVEPCETSLTYHKIPLTVDFSEIQDDLNGTPEQMALVHTVPQVKIANDGPLPDNGQFSFRKAVGFVETGTNIPIHIEMFRSLEKKIIKGVVKQDKNGQLYVLIGNTKYPIPDGVPADVGQFTTFAAPGPPGASYVIVRTLDLSYSHPGLLISGDANGTTGNPIVVQSKGPGSVAFAFTVTEK